MSNSHSASSPARLPSAVLETCLYVEDLQRARAFYTGFFGYPAMRFDERFCAFDVNGNHVLLLFKRGSDPEGTTLPFGRIPPHAGGRGGHIGFSIPKESLGPWRSRLAEQEIRVESEFTWPAGGTSIYFRDPDGNLLELLTPGVWPTY